LSPGRYYSVFRLSVLPSRLFGTFYFFIFSEVLAPGFESGGVKGGFPPLLTRFFSQFVVRFFLHDERSESPSSLGGVGGCLLLLTRFYSKFVIRFFCTTRGGAPSREKYNYEENNLVSTSCNPYSYQDCQCYCYYYNCYLYISPPIFIIPSPVNILIHIMNIMKAIVTVAITNVIIYIYIGMGKTLVSPPFSGSTHKN
jgi:hypothetical protein